MNRFATQRNAKIFAWSLSIVVSFIAFYVWASGVNWKFNGLSLYIVFPIFGMLAFSVMWSHYIVSFLGKTYCKEAELGVYYKVTGYVVLLSILMHPGLLAYQRFKDGFGLPEGSLTSFVQPNLRWVVLLGTVSLLAFLAFELQRWYRDRSWWKYIVSLNDIAMIAIFYHALRLGTYLHGGWFVFVWYFYGLTLFLILANKYIPKVIKSMQKLD